MTLQSQLDQVLSLAEKATPGEWGTRSDPAFAQHEYTHVAVEGDPEGLYVYMHSLANTMAVAAAINFLREYGPAIRAAVGGEAVAVAWQYAGTVAGQKFVTVHSINNAAGYEDADDLVLTPLYASPTATVDVGVTGPTCEAWAIVRPDGKTIHPESVRGSEHAAQWAIGEWPSMRERGFTCRRVTIVAVELAALIGKEA